MENPFNKCYMDEDYFLGYNTKTGFEVLSGINGKADPFSLKLPSLIDIGIMGKCQNKCEFCYQGDIEEDHMDISDFIKIIDQIKFHTNQVALGGRGDPNKHPQFEQFIKYAHENNVVPNYTTSGKGLTVEEVELTKRYCGAVAVSNYNQPFTYDALKMFMDAEVKTNIHFVFSKNTFDDAMNLLQGKDIWDGRVNLDKLNAVVFLLFKKRGRAENLPLLAPTYYQINLLCLAIRSYGGFCKFKIGMDSCLVNHYCDIIANLTTEEKLSLDTCEASRMSAYISPSLIMTPCSFCPPNEGVSIKDIDIKDVWNNSDLFTKTRKLLLTKRNCCPAGC
jgi:MoaA/NifB/PqqE/SkfB family radical SAM enzyme